MKMTMHDYCLKNLNQTVMITIQTENTPSIQYNYWNWMHEIGQLHLLKDDLSIGHILHNGYIEENPDQSLTFNSNLHPKKCNVNFYFGAVTP